MAEPLIELKNIYKIYHMGDEEVRASDGVSLSINRGEFVAIVGKSGSGKSTLMNIIGALDVPTEGEYILGGEDVSEMSDDQLAQIRNKMIGFIFQQYNLLPKLNLLECEAAIVICRSACPGAQGAGLKIVSEGWTGGKMEKPAQPVIRRPAAEGFHCQGTGGRPVPDPGG